MKRSFHILLIILSAVMFISCEKDSIIEPNYNNIISEETDNSDPKKVTIISNWINVQLVETTDIKGSVYLLGRFAINRPVFYDFNTHVQLAFARSITRESIDYLSLPIEYAFNGGPQTTINFGLEEKEFFIQIFYTGESGSIPDPSLFSEFSYRYIVIPKETYENNKINWTNYEEVAAFLNII